MPPASSPGSLDDIRDRTETAMSQAQAQGQWLAGQIASLPRIS